MEPRNNPYTPGSGVQPTEFSGRSEILERVNIALDRLKNGRPTRGFILNGLRGVGKTVLLNKVRVDAENKNIFVIYIEAPEGKSLPAMLIPTMRSVLLQISRQAALKDQVEKTLKVLASFARALKFKYQDIEVAIDPESQVGIADSGDLENDLVELLSELGKAAKQATTAVVLMIDELQYVPEEQLAPLITAFHRLTQHQQPVMMIAAGLPQLLGQMGRAKSYAERLFEFIPIDKLSIPAATEALTKPAEREGAYYNPRAIDEIIKQTQGYPHFIQEWGKHCWNIAEGPEIKLSDAQLATTLSLDELDRSFFRVRFDRLTKLEKKYVRAMAELGPGPHRSGDIAEKIGKSVSAMAPTRASLIKKGMIYSPTHGDTGFTAPLFDGFMKRIMPDFNAALS